MLLLIYGMTYVTLLAFTDPGESSLAEHSNPNAVVYMVMVTIAIATVLLSVCIYYFTGSNLSVLVFTS